MSRRPSCTRSRTRSRRTTRSCGRSTCFWRNVLNIARYKTPSDFVYGRNRCLYRVTFRKRFITILDRERDFFIAAEYSEVLARYSVPLRSFTFCHRVIFTWRKKNLSQLTRRENFKVTPSFSSRPTFVNKTRSYFTVSSKFGYLLKEFHFVAVICKMSVSIIVFF